MRTEKDIRDTSSNDARLDRADFLRLGLLAAGACAVLGRAGIEVRRYLVASEGYQMHERYGHLIGASELRDQVDRFFREVGKPDQEWASRYDLVFDAVEAGETSRLSEMRMLWEERDRRFGFEATYARLFGHDSRYERVCDWKSAEICYDYAFELLRREKAGTYRVPHDPQFPDAMQQMGYIPVQQSQEFDIIMYYHVDELKLEVNPTHWGMMRDGQVISKNFAENYVMRHNIDAIVKDYDSVKGPTHAMYFRKADVSLQDPRVLPLTGRAADFVELNGAMVPRAYVEKRNKTS